MRLRRLRRALLALRGSGVVCETLNGFKFEFDTGTIIGKTLFVEGTFEDAEIAFCAARVRRNVAPVLLDVGANIGWHTLRWAKELPGATIHAFEPSPATRERLARNVTRNGLQGRVHVHPEAVSSTCGKAKFRLTADDAYASLIVTNRNPEVGQVEVPLTTLDAFVAQQGLTRVDFVKIDVEGVEHEVIRGAASMLRAMKPDLLVEIYEGQRTSPTGAEIVSELAGIGYRAYVFEEGQLVPFTTHRDWFYNYFFTFGAAQDGGDGGRAPDGARRRGGL